MKQPAQQREPQSAVEYASTLSSGASTTSCSRTWAGALPGVPEQELRFRWECASGVVRPLVKGSSRVDCDGKCAEDLERMLVPVLAGALAAGAVD